MRHNAPKEPPKWDVRLGRQHGLWVVWGLIGGEEVWFAGLLTEEARRQYLERHPEWTVRGGA